MKRTLLLWSLTAILAAVVLAVAVQYLPKRDAVSSPVNQPERVMKPAEKTVEAKLSGDKSTSSPEAAPELRSTKTNPTATAIAAQTASPTISPSKGANTPQAGQPKPNKKKVLKDPAARDALPMVGMDSDAEMYWYD